MSKRKRLFPETRPRGVRPHFVQANEGSRFRGLVVWVHVGNRVFNTRASARAYLVTRTPRCRCCLQRCVSQWEHVERGQAPYEFCSSCDPGLDEPGGYRCPCRAARQRREAAES